MVSGLLKPKDRAVAHAGAQRVLALEPNRPDFIQVAAELDAITGGDLVDQAPPGRVAVVRIRRVHDAAVVDRYRAGRCDEIDHVAAC